MGMPCAIVGRKKLAYHWLTSQCRERYRRNKLFASIGYHHLNLGPLLHQQAHNKTGFIGSNTASDAQYDFLSFQHVLFKL